MSNLKRCGLLCQTLGECVGHAVATAWESALKDDRGDVQLEVAESKVVHSVNFWPSLALLLLYYSRA